MSWGRFFKFSVWFLASVLLVFILLVLFSPHLSKTDWFQKHSLAYISDKFGGRLKWEGFKWALFPLPRLELEQVSFERTDQLEVESASVRVSPRVLPLFLGRMDLGKVVLEAPSLRVSFRDHVMAAKPFGDVVAGLLGLRAALGSDAGIHLRNGRVALSVGDGPPVSIEEINGRISFLEEQTQVSLQGNSGQLGEIAMDGVIDAEKQRLKGRVALQRFRPHRLLKALLPGTKTGLKDTLVQAILDLEVDGEGNVSLDAEGRADRLVLEAGAQDVEIGFRTFSGSARINGPEVSVVLHQALVDQEGGEVSGTLTLSNRDPRIGVRLIGKGVDVRQVREVTLALAGEEGGVRVLFDVLRAGKVPTVTLSSQGNGLSELTSLANLKVEGEMQSGTIYVREPDLDLRDVSGVAVIQNGRLEASRAQARLGTAANGRNGALTLGLDKGNDRFHLDVEVDADLGQFPLYLPRFLKKGGWRTELSLMDDLRGRASGRLVLGESLKAPRFAVTVSGFDAAANYRRVPFPIQMSGGSITLNDEKVDFSRLGCVVGKSAFKDVSGTLRWDRDSLFEVHSSHVEAVMDELSPWLQSQPALSNHSAEVRDMRGVLSLNALTLKGPLTIPRDWQLEMAGRMEGFSCTMAAWPQRIRVEEGAFSFSAAASRWRLSLGDTRFPVSEGALQATGTIDYDLKSGLSADLTLKGELDQPSMRELARAVGLPPAHVPGNPLSISTARLWRATDGTTRVSVDAWVGSEVSVSLECLVTQERVTVSNLVIREGQSSAQASLTWQDRTLALAFKGDLTQQAFSRLLRPDDKGTGRLKGDFRANIRLDRPLESSLHGSLRVDDFSIPWGPNEPIKVFHCDLNGEEGYITLKSASMAFDGIPFDITGDVWPLAEELFVDLDVSTGRLVWEEVARVLGKKGLKGHGLLEAGPSHLPVRGSLRLHSESLAYGRRNFVPLEAHVTMTDEGWTMEMKETTLCGISMPGVLELSADPPMLRVFPASQGQSLNPAIQCLLGERMSVTGNFDLSGHMEGKIKESPFSKGLRGELAFHARDGRIYRYELLSKIFAFLNLTELLRGKLPDMGKEGFAYNTMRAKADLLDGRLVIREALIDGKSMEIGCEGEVDLIRDQLDLRVLVAPFKTVDFIIKHIPGLNYVLGGTLVSIPVRVSGRLADPTITPLSPSAVGEGLLGIMERALTLPVKMIEPILPETKK